ncbi:DNA-binding transcriptional regulator, MerR family [Solimonas aquatica]|uniref:DNA-binding transcriptional regulator, MerR family n=1 Tax=Solimonas aquatica TaxID=489703 RepID=A0A1H9DRP9_9GAMM|nr:MerR family transcriptional regulator [Solimonas aquatica]SEQ16152.1 DNA-binding transcriptional regulator, MerR family [Solimonas aquatica]
MPRAPKKSADASSQYRIKQVSAMTGVSRETIRFYINEGLLPHPAKTARNMGWYSDRHVELLRLIQRLRQDHFLPLKAIKTLVAGSSDEYEFTKAQTKVLSQIREKLELDSRKLTVSSSVAQVGQNLGLSPKELQELQEIGFAEQGVVTVSDIELAQLWVRMRDNGLNAERQFSPRDLVYLRDLVDAGIAQELHLFEKRIRTMSSDEAARLQGVIIPSLSRIFVILHERRLAHFIQRFVSRQADADAKSAAPRKSPRRSKAGSN